MIDWDLIETHWPDLIRVALSIRQGTLSSTLLLRRLRADSHRNRIYQAFRELGRVIRTITLLRYISEPNLRRQITAATNKAESYNAFSTWLRFAGDVLARNDPAEQEKLVKFNSLLANCVTFHNAIDLTIVLRDLRADGFDVRPEDIANLSPYMTGPIQRFGDYNTDSIRHPPDDFDPHFDLTPQVA